MSSPESAGAQESEPRKAGHTRRRTAGDGPSPSGRRDQKQIPENLSRKGCAPIIGKPRGVTWSAYIFVVFYSGDHYYADPQTPLSRAGPPHLGDLPQADQGGPCVPPCSSRARRRQRPPPPNRLRLPALYLFRAAQVGLSLCA